ncbi:MAG: hypothetical protein DI554_13065 [Sphingobium sp.]|jgi:hypothetical protein|nr:MAG: hypothetical protein DI554_13065 [Sphingobium sp.]
MADCGRRSDIIGRLTAKLQACGKRIAGFQAVAAPACDEAKLHFRGWKGDLNLLERHDLRNESGDYGAV